MDLSMPIMNGYDAVRYLKSYPETAGIPICAISGYVKGDEEAQRVGFDSCLRKPIEPRQMVAEVEDYLGPSRSTSS